MAHPLVDADEGHARETVVERLVPHVEEVEEGLQVGGGPPALEIGVAETEIALADQAGEGGGIVDMHLGHRPGRLPRGPEDAPVGQVNVEPPGRDGLGHVEHPRHVARQVRLPPGLGQDHG